MSKFFTPDISLERSYNINYGNKIYHPHEGHNGAAGGVISSSGFYLTEDTDYTVGDITSREYFLDDDGNGTIRIYYLSDLNKIYNAIPAGSVDYHTGIISLFPMNFLSVSNVNGIISTKVRLTAVPDSYDIVPVRNQILELDLNNTRVSASVDAITSTGQGYVTTTTSTGTTTTTVSTATSTASSSAY